VFALAGPGEDAELVLDGTGGDLLPMSKPGTDTPA